MEQPIPVYLGLQAYKAPYTQGFRIRLRTDRDQSLQYTRQGEIGLSSNSPDHMTMSFLGFELQKSHQTAYHKHICTGRNERDWFQIGVKVILFPATCDIICQEEDNMAVWERTETRLNF